jgi:hypothetical protein
MTLDVLLLQGIREGSRDLWRGMRARVGIRLILVLLLVHLGFFGVLWLLGGAWQAGPHCGAAVGTARLLLLAVALLAACAMAFLDSLRPLIVSGPLLRSLGDLLLSAQVRPAGPNLADQFAAFTSSQHLARAARVLDLPLILFLARIVFPLDVKPLLQAAQTGLGREGLVREIEARARDRAGRTLRRWKAALWLGLALALMVPFIAGWILC